MPAGQKATVIGAAAALIIVPTILLLAPGLTNLLD